MSNGSIMIKEVDSLSADDIRSCDFSFEITGEMIAPYENPWQFIKEVRPYRKTYPFHPAERDDFMSGERMILTAKKDDHLCGYIIVTKAWNNYTLINDFAVDRQMRGSGIGHLLMDKAMDWARNKGLPGIRLETQSNNLLACRFYHQYGFRVGGFDRYLYNGIQSNIAETALFWYFFFDCPAFEAY